MMEHVEFVWYESSREEGWSIGLTERGQLDLHLREGHRWSCRPLNLSVALPIEVFDAFIKHKGETRRYLAKLAEEKT